MGFDWRIKRYNHAIFFSSSVACLRSQRFDSTTVIPEIIRVIGNWGMAVRCWGTKRRQEDMETISPPVWACRYEIKASPPGRRLAHSHAFSLSNCKTCTNTHRKKSNTFYMQTNMFAVCLPTCPPAHHTESLSLDQFMQQKYCIYNTFLKLSATVKVLIH